MNITINIDDKTFNDSNVGASIVEAFNKLSKDEIKDVMKEVLKQYLENDSVIRGYFVRRSTGWGYGNGEIPTQEFKSLISKIDFSNLTDDIKNRMVDMITHDLDKIVVSLVTDSIISGLSRSIANSSEFNDVIRASAESYLRWKDGNK